MSQLSRTRGVMLTTFDLDDYVVDAFRAGASGFLLKTAPPAQLVAAVRTVQAGSTLEGRVLFDVEPKTYNLKVEDTDGAVSLVELLNEVGARNAIGRVDLVENRFVGIKSRGCYETPGGTILVAALRALESLVLDRETAHYSETLSLRYAELVYYGAWFTPQREALDDVERARTDDVEDHEGREVDHRRAVAQREVLGVDDRRPPARLPLALAARDAVPELLEQRLV